MPYTVEKRGEFMYNVAIYQKGLGYGNEKQNIKGLRLHLARAVDIGYDGECCRGRQHSLHKYAAIGGQFAIYQYNIVERHSGPTGELFRAAHRHG